MYDSVKIVAWCCNLSGNKEIFLGWWATQMRPPVTSTYVAFVRQGSGESCRILDELKEIVSIFFDSLWAEVSRAKRAMKTRAEMFFKIGDVQTQEMNEIHENMSITLDCIQVVLLAKPRGSGVFEKIIVCHWWKIWSAKISDKFSETPLPHAFASETTW